MLNPFVVLLVELHLHPQVKEIWKDWLEDMIFLPASEFLVMQLEWAFYFSNDGLLAAEFLDQCAN